VLNVDRSWGFAVASRIQTGFYEWLERAIEREPDDLEMFLAVLSVAWGIVVLNPFADAFQTSASYDSLTKLFPEFVWGLVLIILGAYQLICNLRGIGRHRRSGMYVLSMVWLAIGILCLTSNINSMAGPVYVAFGLGGLWTFVRLPRNGNRSQGPRGLH
jgi:hypothetical protein